VRWEMRGSGLVGWWRWKTLRVGEADRSCVGNMDMSRNVRGEAVPKQCVVDLAPGLEAAPGWCLRAAFNHVTRGGPGLEI
jgi:hypothetical protein